MKEKVTHELHNGSIRETRRYSDIGGCVARRSKLFIFEDQDRFETIWKIYAPGDRGKFIGAYREIEGSVKFVVSGNEYNGYKTVNAGIRIIGKFKNPEGYKSKDVKTIKTDNLRNAVRFVYLNWVSKKTATKTRSRNK